MSEFQHSVKVPRLYKDASRILKSVHEGGSLKDLVYNHNRFSNIKALHALVAESIKFDKILSRVLDHTQILELERFDPWLAKVLLTELIFGKKRLPGNSKPVLTILSYKDNIDKCLDTADIYKFSSEKRLKKKVNPRYVRINTLKISVEDAIRKFKNEGWEELCCPDNYDEYLQLIQDHMFDEEYVFVQDYHVKQLLVFPSTVYFHDHPAYLEKYIILQDKASCLLTCCVAIKPGSVILDMCAAPGMKTALLAACINNQGTIHAVELDERRYNTMVKLLSEFGIDGVLSRNCDAGFVGPKICKDVKYILVDPSCSGNGMTSRIEDAEVAWHSEKTDRLRLQKLANVQGYLLRHALSNFPSAKYIFYSTCSLREEENEVVVESVLGCAKLHGFKLINLKKKIDGWKNFGSDKYECGKKCIYSKPEVDFSNGGFLAVFKRKSKHFTLDSGRKEEFIVLEKPFEEKKLNLSEQFFALVNALKVSVDDAIQSFVDNGWKHLPSPMNYNIFISGLQEDRKRIEEKFFEQDFHVKELLLFPLGIVDNISRSFIEERKFILLDKVACLAVHLLDPTPGSKVLDMCAGTEKMSLFIASRMNNSGMIYAYESNSHFYKELILELKRCDVTCANAKNYSGFYSNSNDCPDVNMILVSPPCSGSGSGLAEKTQYSLIKSTKNINKEYILRNYIVTQFSLLRHAFTEFPNACRVVYVTRSVHPEENEDIINALLILAKFNGFKLIDAPSKIDGWKNECSSKYFWGSKCLTTRDETSITKGFFIAVFERTFENNNLTLPNKHDVNNKLEFPGEAVNRKYSSHHKKKVNNKLLCESSTNNKEDIASDMIWQTDTIVKEKCDNETVRGNNDCSGDTRKECSDSTGENFHLFGVNDKYLKKSKKHKRKIIDGENCVESDLSLEKYQELSQVDHHSIEISQNVEIEISSKENNKKSCKKRKTCSQDPSKVVFENDNSVKRRGKKQNKSSAVEINQIEFSSFEDSVSNLTNSTENNVIEKEFQLQEMLEGNEEAIVLKKNKNKKGLSDLDLNEIFMLKPKNSVNSKSKELVSTEIAIDRKENLDVDIESNQHDLVSTKSKKNKKHKKKK